MLNQVILVGRTTRDVEIKESSNGRPFGIVTIAATRSFKNQETNTYDADFVDVSLWGITAVNVAKYAGKGSALSIRGRVTNRILDFPGEQTIRTIGIVGEQVSFIQTKAPSENINKKGKSEEFPLSDFPTGEKFDKALGANEEEQPRQGQLEQEHGQLEQEHGQLEQEHGQLGQEHGQLEQEHGQLEQEHPGQEQEHFGQEIEI